MARTGFTGSARTVADQIERWFTGAAADGFVLHVTVPSEFARFADEVLPILCQRGLFRAEYESGTLRGNLGLPIPENVHATRRVTAYAPPLPPNASRSLDNAVVLRDPRFVAAYDQEWAQVVAMSEPLDWTADWIDAPWRIGS